MGDITGRNGIPYRTLGTTGEQVSAIGLGGWHLGLKHVDEPLSLRIVREAIDRGINFLDNCWDYNEGASEIRMGKALRDGYRDSVFLMTKIDGRIAGRKRRGSSTSRCAGCRPTASTWCSITRSSATRIRIASSTKTARTARCVDARKAGKIRYIGFTGHKDPRIHLHMLEVAQRARRSVRRRADAAQRDGCALPQLREARAARARAAANWRPRHEVPGQRPDSASRER